MDNTNYSSYPSVIILCGGKGRRLQHVAGQIPKALVPVKGKPILSYTLERFYNSGFRKFVFCTGYLSEQIESFVANFEPKLDTKISNAGSNASMLERLVSAIPDIGDTAIVSYGDTYINLDYQALLKQHRSSGALITLVTGKIQNPFGVIDIAQDNRITSFKEKPTYNYYIGCFAFSRSAIEKSPVELHTLPDSLGLVQLFDQLLHAGALFSYQYEGLQVTFNTEPELVGANQTLEDYYTVKELLR